MDVSARLERSGGVTQLIVHGRSTLLIGGQVHNSTSSHPDSIARAFARAAEIGSNTVFAPVDWAALEPEEGRFDFALVDTMLAEARGQGLGRVPLRFGAFKNAPLDLRAEVGAVATDRFPRAVVNEVARPAFTYAGAMRRPTRSRSSARNCGRRTGSAFAAFMQHLAQTDVTGVVPRVQVENEVGLLADSRDRSSLAEVEWQREVPATLLRHLVSDRGSGSAASALWTAQGRPERGSWPELFGTEWYADEVFMAWAFGSYVEAVAARGSAAHPIPLYVNSWIGPQPGQERAGEYPSGGPGWRVIDVWQAAAPSIDLIGPDIYLDDSAEAMRRYNTSGNPLMVPESRYRVAEAARAFGRHAAIGWSVFGVEDARPGHRVSQLLTRARRYLPSSSPRLSGSRESPAWYSSPEKARRTSCSASTPSPFATRRSCSPTGCSLTWAWRVHHHRRNHRARPRARTPSPTPRTCVPSSSSSPSATTEFQILGQNVSLDVAKRGRVVEWDRVEAGSHQDGRWRPTRVLNGDERLRILPLDGIGAARVRVLSLAS